MKVIHAGGHFGAPSVSPPSVGQSSGKGTEIGEIVRTKNRESCGLDCKALRSLAQQWPSVPMVSAQLSCVVF